MLPARRQTATGTLRSTCLSVAARNATVCCIQKEIFPHEVQRHTLLFFTEKTYGIWERQTGPRVLSPFSFETVPSHGDERVRNQNIGDKTHTEI